MLAELYTLLVHTNPTASRWLDIEHSAQEVTRISAAPSNGPPRGRRAHSEDTHVIHQHDDHVGSLRPRCGAQHKSDQESGDVHLLVPSKSRDISMGHAGYCRAACVSELRLVMIDQEGYFTPASARLISLALYI